MILASSIPGMERGFVACCKMSTLTYIYIQSCTQGILIQYPVSEIPAPVFTTGLTCRERVGPRVLVPPSSCKFLEYGLFLVLSTAITQRATVELGPTAQLLMKS
jgi:hypothetical protein